MRNPIIGATVGTTMNPKKIGNDLKPDIKEYIDDKMGDIEGAIDEIIAIQEALLGGGSV